MHPFVPRFAQRRPWIIGHRGAAGYAVENTLESFQLAWDQGADLIELDLRLTQDHQLVALHDPGLQRLQGIAINASDAPYAQLVRHHPMPRLEEILDKTPAEKWLNLELKADAHEPELLAQALVSKLERFDRAILSSFDWSLLKQVASLTKRFALVPIADHGRAEDLAEAALDVGSTTLHLHHSLATEEILDSLEQRGIAAWVFTVNHPRYAKDLAQRGVRGFFSDYPDVLLDTFAGEGYSSSSLQP